jgi:hypothetical protein
VGDMKKNWKQGWKKEVLPTGFLILAVFAFRSSLA